ncbi:hypothetical protein [Streptomyces sp. NPDC088254]|uniref:hypothetical protein n=1 Tax=Streptomyces sp. NPDC088254 TaxID=3365847 RepID=UPI003820E98D
MAQEVFDELTGQEGDCEEAFYEALAAVQETLAKPEEEIDTVEATVRTGTPRLDALFPASASSNQ